MEKWGGYAWVSFGKNLRMGNSSPRRLNVVNTAKKGSRCASGGPKLMVITACPRMKGAGASMGVSC